MRKKGQEGNSFDLMRTKQESHIWRTTLESRSIIHGHSLLEVRGREDANCWDDSWQQMPKILMHLNLTLCQDRERGLGLIKVYQFWRKEQANEDYHEWNPPNWWSQRLLAQEILKIQ